MYIYIYILLLYTQYMYVVLFLVAAPQRPRQLKDIGGPEMGRLKWVG